MRRDLSVQDNCGGRSTEQTLQNQLLTFFGRKIKRDEAIVSKIRYCQFTRLTNWDLRISVFAWGNHEQ